MRSSDTKIMRVAAYALVLNNEQIVLCRISDQVPRLSGQWTLPGGGLEFGEDPVDAMTREVEEETGLIVRPLRLAGIDSKHITRDGQEFHSIRIIYHAEFVGGELTNEIDGTTDLCGWWSYSQAAELPLVDIAQTGLDMVVSSG